MTISRRFWIAVLLGSALAPATTLGDPPAPAPATAHTAPAATSAAAGDPCRPTPVVLTPFIMDSQGHLTTNPIIAAALQSIIAPSPSQAGRPVHDPADDVQGPAPASKAAPGPRQASAPRLAPLQELPPPPVSPPSKTTSAFHLTPNTDGPGFTFAF